MRLIAYSVDNPPFSLLYSTQGMGLLENMHDQAAYQNLARKLVNEAGVDPTARGLLEYNLGTAMAGGMSVGDAKAALQAAKEAQAPGSVLTPTGPVLRAVNDFYHDRDAASAAQGATAEMQYYVNEMGYTE